MKRARQMSDSLRVAALLALAGGFLDAYTYLCRGGVFANAQTGNLVLLGLRAAQGDFLGCLYYLVPVLCFVLGVLLAELIGHKWRNRQRVHWRQIILLMEIAVLVLVALIPPGQHNIGANSLVSFICALQVQSFRKINGNAYASTMCTGNLRSATEQLMAWVRTRESGLLKNCLHYFGICGIFVVGAGLGVALDRAFSAYAILFACLPLGTAFALQAVRHQTEEAGHGE